MAYLDAPRPRVFAHRGFTYVDGVETVPENTLLAFAHAVVAGATYIETDVHVSSDGVAVILHDPDLERVAGMPGRATDLTALELTAIDLGADQGVPTLAAALDAFGETRFNIDLKTPDVVAPVAEAVTSLRATDRVLLTSFDEATRAAITRAIPGVATSASSRLIMRALPWALLGFAGRVSSVLAGIDAVQVPVSHGRIPVITPRSVDTFHRAGIEVHAWTINDPDEMTRLLDLGVDGLVTDRADLAFGVLAERA